MRWLLALAWVSACGDNTVGDDRLGGATTVDDRGDGAFEHPAANLDPSGRATFQAGTGPFTFRWDSPRLGPAYNNDSCSGCHGSNGRGRSQVGGARSEALVRVSLPGGVPVPGFGLQLHDHSTTGVPPVTVAVSWDETVETYTDGTPFSLRKPVLDIRPADGSPLRAGTLTSYRIAPPVIGLGLLEAVPDDTLVALEVPHDDNAHGVSGRVNRVWNPITQQTEIGRFGWKANVATLAVQVAGAALNDMGLTSRVFPPADGSDPDVSDVQLDQMTFMVATVAVPTAAPRTRDVDRGEQLFHDFFCATCHVPTLETGDHAIPELAHQTIHPYTDLLVHDMGAGLADGRPDFDASGSEWRTPPLWGLGLAQVIRPEVTFLHDGRARTLEEAILWHGGEGIWAEGAFRAASAEDRAALIAFLNTL